MRRLLSDFDSWDQQLHRDSTLSIDHRHRPSPRAAPKMAAQVSSCQRAIKKQTFVPRVMAEGKIHCFEFLGT